MTDLGRMRIEAGYLNIGSVQTMFDDAMYCIGRLATTELIDKEFHESIDSDLDEMIRKLNELKNGTMAGMMLRVKE